MGKTTLWREGLAGAGARGFGVLEALPAENELALSFSMVGDLLDPVLDDALARFPLATACVVTGADPRRGRRAASRRTRSGRCLFRTTPLADRRRATPRRHRRCPSGSIEPRRSALLCRASLCATRRRTARRAPVEPRSRWSPTSTVARGRALHARRRRPAQPAALHGVVQGHLGLTLPRPLLNEVRPRVGRETFDRPRDRTDASTR